MNRRELNILLGGAAASSVFRPPAAFAQQLGKIPRVGVLWHATREEEEKGPLIAFRRGLKQCPQLRAT